MAYGRMTMSKELKPIHCGCGGEASIWYNFGGLCFVSCKKCEITTHGHDNQILAIEAWNRAMGERTAKPKTWDGYSEKGWYKCVCGKGIYQGQNFCSGCGGIARLEWK